MSDVSRDRFRSEPRPADWDLVRAAGVPRECFADEVAIDFPRWIASSSACASDLRAAPVAPGTGDDARRMTAEDHCVDARRSQSAHSLRCPCDGPAQPAGAAKAGRIRAAPVSARAMLPLRSSCVRCHPAWPMARVAFRLVAGRAPDTPRIHVSVADFSRACSPVPLHVRPRPLFVISGLLTILLGVSALALTPARRRSCRLPAPTSPRRPDRGLLHARVPRSCGGVLVGSACPSAGTGAGLGWRRCSSAPWICSSCPTAPPRRVRAVDASPGGRAAPRGY
jgi:hypothetical protein